MDHEITPSLFRRMLFMIAADIFIDGLLVLIFSIEGLPGMFVIIYVFLFCILLFASVSYLQKRFSTPLLANIVILPAILLLFVILSLKLRPIQNTTSKNSR